MGQALYRKYRSKQLDEIVGQEHITETLTTAIKSGRISHAYLFTGPRGSGKTSIARILAHEINGLPYAREGNHIDIIEIDAASNRGIDEIRDLRDKVYMAPTESKYKVYIIDEVHMLTPQAFNALLKTLEEPPEHVVFILATTEAHKLPETIVSRTQRYIFRPVEPAKVVAHLKHIAKQEKIVIDDEALDLFAAHGGGSFRDSISLLDQAGSSGQKIDRARAEAMLGLPPGELIDSLLAALGSGTAGAVLEQLTTATSRGNHPAAIARQLGSALRADYIKERSLLAAETQLRLMRDLLDVAPAHEPLKVLELALLRALPRTRQQATPAPVPSPNPVAVPKKPTAPMPAEPAAAPVVKTPPKTVEAEPDMAATSEAILEDNLWPQLLDTLKSQYNTLYGVLRMAVPEFSAGKLTLKFRFAFHQKRMNEAKHRQIVADAIKQLSGEQIAIECVYDKTAQLSDSPIGSNAATAAEPTAQIPPESFSTISNIFGGGELLES